MIEVVGASVVVVVEVVDVVVDVDVVVMVGNTNTADVVDDDVGTTCAGIVVVVV